MGTVSLIGMLGFCSYEDIRWRKIGVIFVLCFGVLGFIIHMFSPTHSTGDILGGMAIGIIMFIISILSNESIGKGDALILIICGIYLGFWDNLMLLWGAGLLSGLTGLCFIVRGRRRMTLPFVPFLLVTYIVILLTETFVSI